jgi:hypothetical protein
MLRRVFQMSDTGTDVSVLQDAVAASEQWRGEAAGGVIYRTGPNSYEDGNGNPVQIGPGMKVSGYQPTSTQGTGGSPGAADPSAPSAPVNPAPPAASGEPDPDPVDPDPDPVDPVDPVP